MSTQEPSVERQLRVMQLIAAALIAGVAAFTVLVVFLVAQRGGQANAGEGALPVVTLVSVVFLLSAGSAGLFLPRVVLKNAVARLARSPRDQVVLPAGRDGTGGPVSDAAFLLSARTSAMIVGMAMFEGAAFCAGIAYLVEARPAALGVAGVALAGLVSFFPTARRVNAWLAEQRQVVDGLRSRGG